MDGGGRDGSDPKEMRWKWKYRAQTKSPSDGHDIRWYFSKAILPPIEAAASIPTTEVVGKSDYFRYSVRDSLALESTFLEHEEELVSAWWKEYAECSEGPVIATGNESTNPRIEMQASAKKIENIGDAQASVKQESTRNLFYEDADEAIGVLVKGGLYEVDLWKRRCYPVYWSGEHKRVLRGHWFAQKGSLDWLPLREDISEQLETAYCSKVWHRRKFQPSGDFAARVNLQGATQGLHALFVGEDDNWEAWFGVDWGGISQVLGLRGAGVKIRRGFAPSDSSQPTQEELRQIKEEEMDDYCSQVPVRHIVFVIHGIGQRLENANLVDDVTGFRHAARALSEHHLSVYQRNRQRVLFIPCQWRRGLKLGGEIAVEDCTLEGVRALRTMLSATVHDVLYYMSPVYCQDIIDSVSTQLNKLYCKFIKRNPGYDGKVSLYGHSLGSVLAFDILCHQETLTSTCPMEQINLHMSTVNGDNIIDTDYTELMKYNTGLFSTSDQQSPEGEPSIVSDSVDAHECPERKIDKPNVKEIEYLRNEVASLKEKLRLIEGKHQDDSQSITPNCKEKNLCNTDDGSITERQVVIHREGESTSYTSTSPSKSRDKGGFDHMKEKSKSAKRYTPYIKYTKLAFEVDTFFAVGSPIGVFLALRNIRLGMGMGKDYWQDENIEEEMPACRCMFNIFHPYDPVAYRLEPLICKEYINIKPVFVPYHKGGKRLHIGMQELSEELSVRSKALVSSLSTVGSRIVRVFSSNNEEEREVGSDNQELPKDKSYGSLVMERLAGNQDGRIDFMLQDATFEHQYIQAIGSHTSYWQDPDTVLFIVKHLYWHIPIEPPKDESQASTEILDRVPSIDPKTLEKLDESDSTDEEVAFTFSSKDAVETLATEDLLT